MKSSHRMKLTLALIFVTFVGAAGCTQPRVPAHQSMRRNQMMQILIATNSWSLEHNKQLPPLALCDRAGNPLLSWRVALLPYLEQEELYAQFDLEEPWDGPNNRKLLDKMPSFFKLAGVPAKPGFTHLRVFGASGLYPSLKASDVDRSIAPSGKAILSLYSLPVPDGDDQTIFLVEATEAVPWTKPDVFRFDPAHPPRLGFANSSDYFLVGMLDGQVMPIELPVDTRKLAELVDPADKPRNNPVAAARKESVR